MEGEYSEKNMDFSIKLYFGGNIGDLDKRYYVKLIYSYCFVGCFLFNKIFFR